MKPTIVALRAVVSAAVVLFVTAGGAAAVDLTSNNADGAGDMTVARYMVNLGIPNGDSVSDYTAESGLYDYSRSRGNQSGWYVLNNDILDDVAVTYWDCGQWSSTCTPSPDFFGYKFKYPATVTRVTYSDYCFCDGGTFSGTPSLQYLSSPGGSWTTVGATWNTPYDSSFSCGRRNTYTITPDSPINGALGLRLYGATTPSGAMDQSGWASATELKVEGEADFGINISFFNNLAVGSTPVCSNGAWQSGDGSELLDGNFENSAEVWDAGSPSGEKYVGVTWDAPRNNVTALGFGMTFNTDGGWYTDTLADPLKVQYTLDGSTWLDVSGLNKGRYTADYAAAAALSSTYKGSWLFSFDTLNGIRGLRLSGVPGGSALGGYGYVSLREFQVFGSCLEPPSGLVAWWGGDNNALDMVGGHNATPVNHTTYVPGVVGQAFSLDGVDDYLSVPDSPALRFTTALTVEAWFMMDSATSWNAPIVAKGDDSWRLQRDHSNNGLLFGTNHGGPSSGGYYHNLAGTRNVNDGLWHHAAAVFDGTTKYLYIDGTLDVSASWPYTIDTTTADLWIGNNSTYPDRPWKGALDEIGIIDRALSASEIAAIFNAGSAGVCRSCTAPPSDMVSWWGGDNNALDRVGNNNGTMMGAATFASGKVRQAFSFDGAEASFVEIPSTASFNPSGAFTVDGWFYVDPAANAGKIATLVAKTEGSSGNGWALYFDDRGSTKSLKFAVGTVLEVTNAIPAAGWYHVAGVVDPSATPQAALFVNGLKVGDAASGLGSSNDLNVRIGAMYWTDSYHQGNDRLTGLADEVEFFNRALSADEIAAIYDAGSAGKCIPDLTPDTFSFIDVTNAALDTVYESPAIPVNGIDYATPVSIASCTGTGCGYSVNGGDWTADAGSVSNGDTVRVRQTSSGSDGATTDLVLDIGGVLDTFSVTTNHAPVAVDDTATTPEDTPVDIAVLANDSDVDGGTLAIESVTQGAHGAVVIDGTSVTYTPEADWFGEDSFGYTVTDGQGGTDTAIVTVTVTSVNDPPVAVDDTSTTPEDTPVDIAVLVNDSDVDGGTLAIESVAQGAHGAAVINGTSVTYIPAADWFGEDSFGYTVSDGQGGTDTATVTVTVTSVNDPPVLNPVGNQVVAEGAELVIVLGATDPDTGDALTYSASNVPDGAVWNAGTATFTWTPGYDQAGSWAGVRFEVTDGSRSDSETITITVTDHNALLFSDDFSLGPAADDADWEEIKGSWKVSTALSFVSSATKANMALVRGVASVNALGAGVVETRVKLTRQALNAPNGGLLFHVRDGANYRYVKLKATPTGGRLVIGQVGDPAGDGATTFAKSMKMSLKPGRFYTLRLDLRDSGLVEAFVDGTEILEWPFPQVVAGRVGLIAGKAKTFFDDVKVFDDTVLTLR
jgi:hypothetical protein